MNEYSWIKLHKTYKFPLLRYINNHFCHLVTFTHYLAYEALPTESIPRWVSFWFDAFIKFYFWDTCIYKESCQVHSFCHFLKTYMLEVSLHKFHFIPKQNEFSSSLDFSLSTDDLILIISAIFVWWSMKTFVIGVTYIIYYKIFQLFIFTGL